MQETKGDTSRVQPQVFAKSQSPSPSFRTYHAAIVSLPHEVEWRSSFGYPDEGGFVEYWRTPDGQRFSIENGSHHEHAPFIWTVRPV